MGLQVTPRPYLYYGVSKGSSAEVLGPPMSQSRNNREGSQYESVLDNNNRSPNNKESESLVQ